MKTFSPQIYRGFLMCKNDVNCFSTYMQRVLICTFNFTTNLCAVCQPVHNGKSRQYRSENALRYVCHEHKYRCISDGYLNCVTEGAACSNLTGAVHGTLMATHSILRGMHAALNRGCVQLPQRAVHNTLRGASNSSL